MNNNEWTYLLGTDKQWPSLALQYYTGLLNAAKRNQTSYLGRKPSSAIYFRSTIMAWTQEGKLEDFSLAERCQSVTADFIVDKCEELKTKLAGVDLTSLDNQRLYRPLMMVMFNNWYYDKMKLANNRYRKAVASTLGWANQDGDNEMDLHETRTNYINQELVELAALYTQEDGMSNRQKVEVIFKELTTGSYSEDEYAVVLNELGICDITAPGRRYNLPTGVVSHPTYNKLRDSVMAKLVAAINV